VKSSSNWSTTSELGAVICEHALDGPQQASLVLFELRQEARRRVDRDPQQRRFQLLERVRAGGDRDHLLELGAESGDETGADDGRLPAAARPDHREEAGLAHPAREALDQPLASEEVVCVRLEEGAQSLIGIRRTRWASEAVAVSRRLQLQIRVLTKDLAHEVAEIRRGLHAELVDERPSCRVVCLQRLGMASRAVQGEHQLAAVLLA
jgi:hypothetical protein